MYKWENIYIGAELTIGKCRIDYRQVPINFSSISANSSREQILKMYFLNYRV
jgi:hypothetical protein